MNNRSLFLLFRKKVENLNNRLKVMEENPEAVFVSVHLNKFTTSKVSGAQVFYSDNFVSQYLHLYTLFSLSLNSKI